MITTMSSSSCSGLGGGAAATSKRKSPEPTSVLYNRSPSPPTSSSAHSSDGDGDLEPQAAVDELLEAARRADAGDPAGAREILARLNHRLPSPPAPPGHPPLLRAAALLRDALLHRLLPPTPSSSVLSPLDVALKLAAHKALADASPTVQFAGFTATQAFLDALGAGARRVHVVDLDIGFGGHWPPLMQELAHHWRRTAASSTPPPALKVTALVSPGSRHPLELHLTQESLARFAAELGIPFEFAAVAFDPFSASPPPGLSAAPDEAVAVHITVGTETSGPTPASLRVVKQLRPAIVVCVDHGCDRADLPLPSHALNVLRSCAALVESLDTPGASLDVAAKVEQFILRPRAERLVAGGEKLPPWRSTFASAGLAPLQLSNAAEAQAECLLRRTANHGFHVEKHQSALALWWQRSELVSVSAWRC
ncbi:unnamed protein product [Triticum turgidum subsp. durum]|uniref:Scarecrow-like protein 6 n=1 Tax=Triticum turgidum subsp. durum TaxID=4567 RepID=A0A9R0SR31_TRITD|nr:unnamed protein product [Triticum turgidum subsp. durum]